MLWLLLLTIVTPMSLALRLHSYFTPGMMMQREVPTKVWGFDLVGSIDAELSCQVLGRVVSHKLTTVRSMEGVWEAELPSQLAGTVCDFQATSETEDIVLTDIMFGDIWLCSGQSNMEMAMRFIMNATEEIEASASFTSIRYTVVKNAVSTTEDLDADTPLQQPWADPTDVDKLGAMSATCFLFARSLQQLWQAAGQEPVPLGLVDSDWGGTPVESWSTPESLASCEATHYCDEERPQGCPSRLYNAMIHPLARVALKGFLWYQGESNSGISGGRDVYNCTFPAMIDAWRELFSSNSNTDPEAPFGFVQLASNQADSQGLGFPVIRWHQTADYGYVPNERLKNVFMASPLDTYDDKEGYPGGIHPRYKQIVGERLAVAGIYVAYGMQEEPYRPYGPLPISVDLDRVNMLIKVTYEDDIVYDNTEISGFYFCEDSPLNCDDTNSVARWTEIGKGAVMQFDSKTLSISIAFTTEEFSLAYAWRETPVKRYLGLPVYGDEAHFSLPSPPWKKGCSGSNCS